MSLAMSNVARFGRGTLRSSLALLSVQSVVGAIGRAGLRKEVGLLRPEPRGPKVLRHQMVGPRGPKVLRHQMVQ